MYRTLSILILGAITINCQNNAEENKTLSKEAPASESRGLPLEKFSIAEWPDVIKDCSCSFSLEGDTDSTFIYVDDYQHMAFVKVNGAMLQMELVDLSKNDSELTQNCESEDFSINVKMNKTGTVDELNLYKGQITVKNNSDKSASTFMIKGACGCY